MDTQRNRLVFYLNAGHLLDHLFMLIFPTVVLALSQEWNRPYSELLPLSMGAFIAFGAGSIPAGWLADHWSRFGMMVMFFIGIGAASILTGFAQEPWHIAACLTLIGMFAAIYHPVGIAMLVANETTRLGRTLGVNGVWGNFGVAFAALVSGALAQWFGWRTAFIVPGILSIAVGVAFYFAGRGITVGKTAAKGPGPKLPMAVLARIFVIIAITTSIGGLIFNATTVSMPKLFDERLNALTNTTLGIGVLVCIVYMIAAMAQLLVGRLIDSQHIKNVFVAVTALQIPLLLLAGVSQDVVMLIVAVAMMFFVFGQIPINDAMIARYTADEWRARAYAVRYVVSFSASTMAVPLIAWVHARYGDLQPLYVVLGVLALALVGAALAFPGERAFKTQPA